MINFKIISKIFSGSFDSISEDQLINLIKLNFKQNKKQWNLEDSSRMKELGPVHVAKVKQEIDKSNQTRNNLIREIDVEIVNLMQINPLDSSRFYGETPGMIIDRLAILFIKHSVIKDFLAIIQEPDLAEEYEAKEKIILRKINLLGDFLDSYFEKLKSKEVFFEIQEPVKIYNDERIKKYIKMIKHD